MISRLVTVAAAILMAATPTVRAFCDVSCLPIEASTATRHCASPVQDEPSVPAPDDRCGHEHLSSESVLTSSKLTIAPPQLAAAATVFILPVPIGAARTKSVSARPPGVPAPAGPRPLRI